MLMASPLLSSSSVGCLKNSSWSKSMLLVNNYNLSFMDKSEEQVCSCSSFMRQRRYFGSYMEVDAWIPMVGWGGARGECVCIIDRSTGSGERRARATSLKQHQGGMQGPEMGRSTKNQTILWGAFPTPVANSCPYFHSECPPLFLRPVPSYCADLYKERK